MRVVLGLLATVLLLLVPLAQAQTPKASPQIDEQARTLLLENEQAMLALTSYSAECWTTMTYPPTEKYPTDRTRSLMATLTAVKPNRMRYEVWEMVKVADGNLKKKAEIPNRTITTDGKVANHQSGNTFRTSKQVKPSELSTSLEPWVGFYSSEVSLRAFFAAIEKEGQSLDALQYIGQETIEGTSCEVIAFKYHGVFAGQRQESEGKLYIGPDKLVRRQVETTRFDGRQELTRDSYLRNIRTNFPAPSTVTFTYKPPKGVMPEPKDKRDTLLKNGTMAPNFTVRDQNGKPVKLTDFRGKVVVLDFWATWCYPCINSFPDMDKLAKKYASKGVVFLAVNIGDDQARFKAWLSKNKQYSALRFLIDPNAEKNDIGAALYKVSAIPTQYIIDGTGRIRHSFVGGGQEAYVEMAVMGAKVIPWK